MECNGMQWNVRTLQSTRSGRGLPLAAVHSLFTRSAIAMTIREKRERQASVGWRRLLLSG